MELVVASDHEGMSRRAVESIVAAARARPDLLFCAPTGATPSRVYELLAERSRRDPELFARLRVVQLDEWGGLDPEDPATCGAYLRERLIGPLAIAPERFLAFSSRPSDPVEECRRVTRILAEWGPIDLCLLGLGRNGHLGLNEPAAEWSTDAHVVRLDASTSGHPMLEVSGARPTHGWTLGIRQLLDSRRILLLVSGAVKRAPLARLLDGEESPRNPASCLRGAAHATVIASADALLSGTSAE